MLQLGEAVAAAILALRAELHCEGLENAVQSFHILLSEVGLRDSMSVMVTAVGSVTVLVLVIVVFTI